MRVKSIAFNELDPDQAKLLEHAEKRSNFSAYVKRLIQRDMEGGYSGGVVVMPENNIPAMKDLVKGLI
jgi:hypothetical protein